MKIPKHQNERKCGEGVVQGDNNAILPGYGSCEGYPDPRCPIDPISALLKMKVFLANQQLEIHFYIDTTVARNPGSNVRRN